MKSSQKYQLLPKQESEIDICVAVPVINHDQGQKNSQATLPVSSPNNNQNNLNSQQGQSQPQSKQPPQKNQPPSRNQPQYQNQPPSRNQPPYQNQPSYQNQPPYQSQQAGYYQVPPPRYYNYGYTPAVQIFSGYDPMFTYNQYPYGTTQVYRPSYFGLGIGGAIINQPYVYYPNNGSQQPQNRQQPSSKQPQKGNNAQKDKIPQMKVACNHCTMQQSVQSNTQVYICCECNNMNECEPLYGIFICGKCESKVWYPFGVSQLMRCTKCSTTNRVPTEPQKTYKDKEQFKNKSYKVEKEKTQNNKEKEQSLKFEQLPHQTKKDEGLYPNLNDSF